MWVTVVSGLPLWLGKLEKLEKVLFFHLELEEHILLMQMLAGKADFFPGVYFYILPSKLANLEIAQTLKENKSARVCDLSVMVLM